MRPPKCSECGRTVPSRYLTLGVEFRTGSLGRGAFCQPACVVRALEGRINPALNDLEKEPQAGE